MIFRDTGLADAWVIDLEPAVDERGFFARTFSAEQFAERRLNPHLEQCSISFNERAGTLRGLHFQAPPHAEAKLVRCVGGALYDVILDLRPDSDSYLSWFSVELSAENRRSLYIPEGFAHGFQTLEDSTEIFYAISAAYEPSAARGVRWDDPAFGIVWPDTDDRVISERDRALPDYEESVLR